MPLYASAFAEEDAALTLSRTLLSNSTGLQQILGAADAAEALPLIVLGPTDPPFDREGFTVGELSGRPAYAMLGPPPDEEAFMAMRSQAVGAISEKVGYFRLHVRCQLKNRDYDAAGGKTDCWLWFLSRTSRMVEQFIEAADLNLASATMKRTAGPFFNPPEDRPTQGVHLWADFRIDWGGSEQAE